MKPTWTILTPVLAFHLCAVCAIAQDSFSYPRIVRIPPVFAPYLLPTSSVQPCSYEAGLCDQTGCVTDTCCEPCPTVASDCDACEVTCCSRWSFRGGMLAMTRERPDSDVLIFDTGDPTRNLNANDFDFRYEAGYEAAVTLHHNSCMSTEVRTMSVQDWHAEESTTFVAPNLLQINTAPANFLTNVTRVNSQYDSEIMSFELNQRWKCNRFTFLAGFRYLELDETFHFDADAGLVLSTYDTVTQNRMYGGQIGSEVLLCCLPCVTVDAFGKAGLYHNAAGQHSTFNTGAALLPAAERDGSTAFLGEFGISARGQLTCCVDLIVGYNLMWADSVALATNQVRVTEFLPGARGLDTSGDVFYHGSFVALEMRR